MYRSPSGSNYRTVNVPRSSTSPRHGSNTRRIRPTEHAPNYSINSSRHYSDCHPLIHTSLLNSRSIDRLKNNRTHPHNDRRSTKLILPLHGQRPVVVKCRLAKSLGPKIRALSRQRTCSHPALTTRQRARQAHRVFMAESVRCAHPAKAWAVRCPLHCFDPRTKAAEVTEAPDLRVKPCHPCLTAGRLFQRAAVTPYRLMVWVTSALRLFSVCVYLPFEFFHLCLLS